MERKKGEMWKVDNEGALNTPPLVWYSGNLEVKELKSGKIGYLLKGGVTEHKKLEKNFFTKEIMDIDMGFHGTLPGFMKPEENEVHRLKDFMEDYGLLFSPFWRTSAPPLREYDKDRKAMEATREGMAIFNPKLFSRRDSQYPVNPLAMPNAFISFDEAALTLGRIQNAVLAAWAALTGEPKPTGVHKDGKTKVMEPGYDLIKYGTRLGGDELARCYAFLSYGIVGNAGKVNLDLDGNAETRNLQISLTEAVCNQFEQTRVLISKWNELVPWRRCPKCGIVFKEKRSSKDSRKTYDAIYCSESCRVSHYRKQH